jgi:hypothetical protein
VVVVVVVEAPAATTYFVLGKIQSQDNLHKPSMLNYEANCIILLDYKFTSPTHITTHDLLGLKEARI